MSNEPSSRVSSATNTDSSSRSPTSSASAWRSSRSMASTTSYASSMMNGLRLARVGFRSQGQRAGPGSRVINWTSSSNVRLCMTRHSSGRLSASMAHTQLAIPMSDHVLIVAAGAAARTPVEVATSLSFTPVVVASEQEAIALLDERTFTLIAVSGVSASWHRLRDVAERKQPMARVLELPETNGDETAIRGLMVRYLDRRRAGGSFTEERYRFLSSMLESFTTSLE